MTAGDAPNGNLFDEASRGIPPAPSGLGGFNVERHVSNTRRGLAYASISLVALFNAVPLVFLAMGVIGTDDFPALIASFAPIQTLAAVAFGFFFAKVER